MEPASETAETPSTFLDDLASKLAAEADVDVELATILKTHILVSAAPDNAVAYAKAALLALASSRAAPETGGGADGK